MERYSSPTISNAIETLNVRPNAEGFLDASVHLVAGGTRPWTAYAATARMRSGDPSEDSVPLSQLLRHIESIPSPRVVIVEDLDESPVGCLWGEVMATIHMAFGCIAAVTNGGVRDIPEVDSLGFRFYAGSVMVSRADGHLVEVGQPVHVGGMTVEPGALFHGDGHGLVEVPFAVASQVAEVAGRIEAEERDIISFVREGQVTIDVLDEFLAKYE
jgi:regulator of RNase E activity RraA